MRHTGHLCDGCNKPVPSTGIVFCSTDKQARDHAAGKSADTFRDVFPVQNGNHLPKLVLTATCDLKCLTNALQRWVLSIEAGDVGQPEMPDVIVVG